MLRIWSLSVVFALVLASLARAQTTLDPGSEPTDEASVFAAWQKAKQEGRLKLLEGEKWYDIIGPGIQTGSRSHYGYLQQKGERIERDDKPDLFRFEDRYEVTFVGYVPGGTWSGELFIEVTEDFVVERFQHKYVHKSFTPVGELVTTTTVEGEREDGQIGVTLTRESGKEEKTVETKSVELPMNTLIDFIPADNMRVEQDFPFCILARVLMIWEPESQVELRFRRFSPYTGELSGDVRAFKATGIEEIEVEGRATEAQVYEAEAYDYPGKTEYVHAYRIAVVPGMGPVSYSAGRVDHGTAHELILSTKDEATRPVRGR